LEEEVLLSLPIAPKHELGHELGACQTAGGENKPLRPSLPQEAQDMHEEEKNPFAALAKLKRSA
jgi:uncharacterized metal-binding protein YceD (DUF177 family)